MKKLLYLATLVLLCAACTPSNKLGYSNSQQHIRIQSDFLTIYPGTNYLDLSLLTDCPEAVDSVTANATQVRCLLKQPNNQLSITCIKAPQFFNLAFWIQGVPYSLLCRCAYQHTVDFSAALPELIASSLQLAGTCNRWDAQTYPPLQRDENGNYSGQIPCFAGTYAYALYNNSQPYYNHSAENSIQGIGGQKLSLLSVGNDPTNRTPLLLTHQLLENKIRLKHFRHPRQVFAYWQDFLLPEHFYHLDDSLLTVLIPQEAQNETLSFLRIVAVNNSGNSNTIRIPLYNGCALPQPPSSQRVASYPLHPYFPIPTEGLHTDSIPFKYLSLVLNQALLQQGSTCGRLGSLPFNAQDSTEMLLHATLPVSDFDTDSLPDNAQAAQWWQWRNQRMEWKYGEWIELITKDNLWVYIRHYFGQISCIAVNRFQSPIALNIKLPIVMQGKQYRSLLGTNFEIKGDTLSLQLDAKQAEILLTDY